MKGISDMSIGDFRRKLSDRLDAAFYNNEATVIRNIRRDRRAAALVPAPWVDELDVLRTENALYRAKYGPITAD